MIHKLANRPSNVCVIIAIVMAIVALSYVTWALADTDEAAGFWALFAAVMAALSVWNLLVYYERARIVHEARRRQREKGLVHG